ncbi:nucleotidyltransferase domain-containing protein [Paenibacillus nicotianae]|uniref:Nucleotidyltransferase domain-containing protein n=1 Tax=Paenibacillus nicotianae TaxID=1526551 RepID=A0ABW4UX58_9BACL
MDIHNWQPLTVKEVNLLFQSMPIVWGIAGGWALDLHIGRQIREHKDIDVIVFRQDQQKVYSYLSQEWILYKVYKGTLEIWKGEPLEQVNDIWVKKDEQSAWSFQLMFVDQVDENWIYRRHPMILRKASDIFLTTTEHIRYLRPEIQLLYKGGSSVIREKDNLDWQTMLPYLTVEEKEWLVSGLKGQFPEGHRWIE